VKREICVGMGVVGGGWMGDGVGGGGELVISM
jgi:hypothetical protein